MNLLKPCGVVATVGALAGTLGGKFTSDLLLGLNLQLTVAAQIQLKAYESRVPLSLLIVALCAALLAQKSGTEAGLMAQVGLLFVLCLMALPGWSVAPLIAQLAGNLL